MKRNASSVEDPPPTSKKETSEERKEELQRFWSRTVAGTESGTKRAAMMICNAEADDRVSRISGWGTLWDAGAFQEAIRAIDRYMSETLNLTIPIQQSLLRVFEATITPIRQSGTYVPRKTLLEIMAFVCLRRPSQRSGFEFSKDPYQTF